MRCLILSFLVSFAISASAEDSVNPADVFEAREFEDDRLLGECRRGDSGSQQGGSEGGYDLRQAGSDHDFLFPVLVVDGRT